MKDEYIDAESFTDASLTVIHHALRAPRRRLAVTLVAYRAMSDPKDSTRSHPPTTTISVRQLAKEIVAIEENVPVDHATGDPYHNVYTALIQTHLPELDSAGAINYDDDRKEVQPDGNLIPLAMAATLTSHVAQLLFHDAIVREYGVPPLS